MQSASQRAFVLGLQALDRGAALVGADCIVTGHNADDIAGLLLLCHTMLAHAGHYIGHTIYAETILINFAWRRRAPLPLHRHNDRRSPESYRLAAFG